MRRILMSCTVFVGLVVVVIGGAGAASAGGWALSTLDEAPTPAAGEPVLVGFTILQHGVSPANPDGEVAIVIRSADGAEEVFAATASGRPGHHVAEVVFPAAGTWTWAVKQGWFPDHDLGPIDVMAAGPTDAGRTADTYRWPAPIRFGLPALTAILGALALAGLAVDLERRRRPVTT